MKQESIGRFDDLLSISRASRLNRERQSKDGRSESVRGMSNLSRKELVLDLGSPHRWLFKPCQTYRNGDNKDKNISYDRHHDEVVP